MRAPLFALALLVIGCSEELPPEGQVVVTVWTDAPLPGDTGTDAPGGVPALFDRLRFDIVPPGSDTPCDDCSREFGIDHETVASGRASIGVAPPIGEEGWRVRVRLYRSGGTLSPDPRPASTLEKVIALPPVNAEGKVPLSVVLWTDTVAFPVGSLTEPREPDTAPFPPPGAWGRRSTSASLTCSGARKAREASTRRRTTSRCRRTGARGRGPRSRPRFPSGTGDGRRG